MFDSDPWFQQWAGRWHKATGFPQNIAGAWIKLVAEAGRWIDKGIIAAIIVYFVTPSIPLAQFGIQVTGPGTFLTVVGMFTAADWCNGTIDPER